MTQLVMLLIVILTAIAVLTGLGYGIRTLRLMADHPNHLSLRLAALNLLEPSVTIATLLAVGFAMNAFGSSELILLALIAGVPLTVMLLAPLFTRATQSLHRLIAVYGLLRWLNTVALWIIVGRDGIDYQLLSDATRLMSVIALIASGLVVLIASVLHIGSSLNAEKIQSV